MDARAAERGAEAAAAAGRAGPGPGREPGSAVFAGGSGRRCRGWAGRAGLGRVRLARRRSEEKRKRWEAGATGDGHSAPGRPGPGPAAAAGRWDGAPAPVPGFGAPRPAAMRGGPVPRPHSFQPLLLALGKAVPRKPRLAWDLGSRGCKTAPLCGPWLRAIDRSIDRSIDCKRAANPCTPGEGHLVPLTLTFPAGKVFTER